MRPPQGAGDGGHRYVPPVGPCCSAPQRSRHCWRCSMHDRNAFYKIAAVALVSVAIFGTACEGPALLSAPIARLSSELAPAADASYSVIGDCARATVIDPGSETKVAVMWIHRGPYFECPLTGDIHAVAPVVLNLTLRNVGTPQVEGRVFGESIFLVTKFFGRTDLNGTFEGPFNGSLEEVRFGAAKTNRHGTGDFSGLVLHGVAVQNPPGSGTEVENGRVVGGDEP